MSSTLIFQGFTEKTTSHGIPHIYFAHGGCYNSFCHGFDVCAVSHWLVFVEGMLKKVVWSVMSLVALVVLILHVNYLATNWLEAEVTTSFKTVSERKLVFPGKTE